MDKLKAMIAKKKKAHKGQAILIRGEIEEERREKYREEEKKRKEEDEYSCFYVFGKYWYF